MGGRQERSRTGAGCCNSLQAFFTLDEHRPGQLPQLPLTSGEPDCSCHVECAHKFIADHNVGDDDDDDNDDNDDDDGLQAHSHHDKFPPWWDSDPDDDGGNLSVTKSHH